MAANNAATLQRALDNYCRQLVLLTEVIANPTQANVDAVVAGGATTNLIQFQTDYSADGKSYNWTAYQTFIIQQIKALKEAIQMLGGPWEVRTQMRPY